MEYNTISTFGSHSALDVCSGAKELGFKTLVLAKKGREKTYAKTYASRKLKNGKQIGCVDACVVTQSFEDMKSQEVLRLFENTIFVPNRSFAVYLGYDFIENEFNIPIFGNKYLLRAEERDAEKNQYFFLEKAGLNTPKKIKSYENMEENKVYIVKVSEAKRSYERAFFLCKGRQDFLEKSEEMKKKGKITQQALENAIIEEYSLGVHFNLNFFASKVHNQVELLGIDTRRQTNLEGFVKLPAKNQLELDGFIPKRIEAGHIACTLRESLLEKAQAMGEKFVKAVNENSKYGIEGPFALQCILEAKERSEEFTVFDVSFRMPGSPGVRYTPYSYYLYGEHISFGKRIAMEIKDAIDYGEIDKILT